MTRFFGIPFVWLAVLTITTTGYTQTTNADSLTAVQDSLNSNKLQAFDQKLAEIEFQRVQDSLKKVALQEEIDALKTTDNLKKEELQAELNALSEAEEQRLTEKKLQIDAMRLTSEGFPVIDFFDDTLFSIYTKLGSFSAMERASTISARIIELEDDFDAETETLTVVESEGVYDIMYNTRIILTVTENDALWNDKTVLELANDYAEIITNSILHYQDETSLGVVLKRIGLVILVLLITILLIFYLGKLFHWTAQKIEEQDGKKLKGITIKNYTLFDSKREVQALLTVNKIIKWLFILLVVYIALPILFGIFPWTANFADTLFGYVVNPVKKIGSGFISYLPNLITIVVIVFIFRWAMRGIHFLKTEIEKGNLQINGFYPDWANPTYHIVRVLIFAFMIVVIFPYLPGSDSPIFQGVSVFLGFLLTFGSAGSLSNIVAGLVLTYMRLFKIGDRVKIGDVVGDVIEKSLLVTRVRTVKNEIISIPNSTVMSSHTINYSSDAPAKGLIVHTTITIGYDVPWKKMHETLIEAAKRTDLILDEPEPFVLQTSLEDFYVAYQINGYVREPNKQAKIYSDLHANIQDVCNENGIEILSPHYRAARDGNTTTIPANYLNADYEAPSFNVKMKKD